MRTIHSYLGFHNEQYTQPMSGLRRKTRAQFGLVHRRIIDPYIFNTRAPSQNIYSIWISLLGSGLGGICLPGSIEV